MIIRSRTWLLLAAIVAIVIILVAIWTHEEAGSHGRIIENQTPPSQAEAALGEEEGSNSDRDRREVPVASPSQDIVDHFDGVVVCQAVRPNNQRVPLPTAQVRLQTNPPTSIEPFAEGVANESGVIALSIPAGKPFVLHGFSEGVIAKWELPALSKESYDARFPAGIHLDFFLDPVTVQYSISGAATTTRPLYFLGISSAPIQRMVMPRDDDHVDLIRPSSDVQAVTGQFNYHAGSELHWALVSGLGLPVVAGRSGRVMQPGETYLIEVDIARLETNDRRYFRISEGRDIFSGLFMDNILFYVYSGTGDYYGSVQASVAEDGRFDLELPDSDLVLVLQHSKAQTTEIAIRSGEGAESANPIEIAVSRAVRVLLRRNDWPQVAVRDSFTLQLESRRWRTGTVVDSDQSPDDLELLGGWSPIVRSFRFGDQLFLTKLPLSGEVRLPGPYFEAVSLPEVIDCTVEIEAAEVMEELVQINFLVREELWQLLRVYAPMRARVTIQTRLPLETGKAEIREGSRPSVTIPYTVDANGNVVLRWYNR